MNKEYDYLIVGAGLFGSVCAHQLRLHGRRCLVIDKRNHIGGNCYTESIKGIPVHKYGGHIFHTNDITIWNYVNRLAEFNNYQHRIKVSYKNDLYSFPINLFTFYQIYGTVTPKEALEKLQEVLPENKKEKDNLESWAISQIGYDLYKIFIEGYTKKQWGEDPKNLPSSIIKRIPIRLTYNDNYYNDLYQGIPIGGYTKIFEELLDNIEVKLNTDYFDNRDYFNSISSKIIYTGNIDRFYDYKFGRLDYRSLNFDTKVLDIPDFQGTATINYTDRDVPYTRIIEHKHFVNIESDKTVVTYEYPWSGDGNNDFYYPINDEKNDKMFLLYNDLTKENNRVIIGGRIGSYSYMDMDKTIMEARKVVYKETNEL